MPLEYEALVGHLYIVGGRTISAAPPGTLVEVAPKKAARGRELDTFFVMVLPAGETIAPAAFYEQMCQVSAERYFSSSGSVTSALRAILNSLNDDLYQHNATDPKRYEASILCAVLRGPDLYLARVGSGIAVLHQEDALQPFPTDFDNKDALYGPPLGIDPVADIRMAHYEVSEGTRLVLSDPHLSDVEMDRLGEALDAEDVAGALVNLKDLILNHAIMMVVEFVSPEAPVALPVHEGESTEAMDALEDIGEGGKRKRTPGPLDAPVRSLLGKGALALAGITRVFSLVFERLLPPPKEPRRSRLSTPLAAGAAVLVPVIVVALVLVLWLTGIGESEFEQCLNEASTAAGVARQVSPADVAGTLAAWNAVLTVTARCEELREGDLQVAALEREGRDLIDRLLQISRRRMTRVASFPSAGLARIVLQGEDLYVLDDRNDLVYRVKVAEDGLSLAPGSQQPIQSMRRTARVAEFTVGDILDIAWAQDGRGLSQPNVLVALDANGVLIECPPRFLDTLSCGAQQLLNRDTWVSPIAITFWQGRLYILDPGANQIWRYEPGPTAFTNAPTEYFVGSGRPDIRMATDFGIDDSGQVYILMSNGAIKKYNSGQEVPFGYAGFPDGQQIATAQGMFLNRNPIAQGLLITDENARTVYETTLGGTFIAAYRPHDEEIFASLADAVVDQNRRIIYAVSGNSIFGFLREE
ncbi:MAG: hypothetical protein DIU68_017490 [Chloroflexota bacterium]